LFSQTIFSGKKKSVSIVKLFWSAKALIKRTQPLKNIKVSVSLLSSVHDPSSQCPSCPTKTTKKKKRAKQHILLKILKNLSNFAHQNASLQNRKRFWKTNEAEKTLFCFCSVPNMQKKTDWKSEAVGVFSFNFEVFLFTQMWSCKSQCCF
jgi:hypothetical protein